MRIFTTKVFSKWAKKTGVTDSILAEAAIEVSKSNYDASLGGKLYKKRVATKGRGKRSSTRTIIAFEANKHIFYLFGFEKKERPSISNKEETALKLIAKGILNKSEKQINNLVNIGSLIEVKHEQIT